MWKAVAVVILGVAVCAGLPRPEEIAPAEVFLQSLEVTEPEVESLLPEVEPPALEIQEFEAAEGSQPRTATQTPGRGGAAFAGAGLALLLAGALPRRRRQ